MTAARFAAGEFACHCGCGVAGADPVLRAGLELLEQAIGPDRLIRVVSGCRCKARNAAVGGAPNSLHVADEGTPTRAADITVRGMTQKELYLKAAGIPQFFAGGIGVYPGRGFIHVDVRGVRARWAKIGTRYTGIADGLEALKREGEMK